jgi:hypothetical protein
MFVTTNREVFNFSFAGIKVSLAYHPTGRDQLIEPRNCHHVELAAPECYLARFGANAALGHLEYPAFVELEDVRTEAGAHVADMIEVVSYSKAFCFCRPGDTVKFRARMAEKDDESDPFLVVPSYGPGWPVQIVAEAGGSRVIPRES